MLVVDVAREFSIAHILQAIEMREHVGIILVDVDLSVHEGLFTTVEENLI
jgi:hypothetical protein